MQNRRLFPKPDLSDVELRRTEFNDKRRRSKLSVFGSEYVLILNSINNAFVFFSQFKRVLLTALGQIVKGKGQEDYEPSHFMVRKNGNPAEKLKTALKTFALYLKK